MAIHTLAGRRAHGYPVCIDDTTGLITDRSARNIAAEWHDGGKLYQLASTGHVEHGVTKDVAATLDLAETDNDVDNLSELLAYCRAAGDDSEF